MSDYPPRPITHPVEQLRRTVRALDADLADVERFLAHLDPLERHEQTAGVLELLSAWYDRLDADLEAVPLPPARSTVDVDTNGRT